MSREQASQPSLQIHQIFRFCPMLPIYYKNLDNCSLSTRAIIYASVCCTLLSV
jgi:hypothetical protein